MATEEAGLSAGQRRLQDPVIVGPTWAVVLFLDLDAWEQVFFEAVSDLGLTPTLEAWYFTIKPPINGGQGDLG